jgi:hypothetical protein
MSAMKKATIFILIIVGILASLLIYRAATAEYTATYYSPSIIMDGTYDWEHAMFSWNPNMMPGYAIDLTNIQCIGTVRVNIQTYKCVLPYDWYYDIESGRYYFTATLNMPALCGMSSVSLQPFLDVYNQNTGAHDRIWGNSESVDYSWCDSLKFPFVPKSYSSNQSNAYPAPQTQQEVEASKKPKARSTPYP